MRKKFFPGFVTPFLSLLVMSPLLLVSCGKSETELAERMYDSISLAFDGGDTLTTLAMVDTLNARFPRQVATRKKAKKIELQILIAQQQAAKKIAEHDLDSLRETFNATAKRFYFERDERYQSEGRYQALTQKTERIMFQNVLRPVVTEQGEMRLEGILRGCSLKAECASVRRINGEKIQLDTVLEKSAYNYVWNDGVRVNRTLLFRDETRIFALADFVKCYQNERLTITYRSTQNDGSFSYPISRQEIVAIVDAADLARKLQALREAEHEISVADKKIEVYQNSLMYLESNEMNKQKEL